MRAFGVLLALSSIPACFFDASAPADARVTCTSSGDCPQGSRCAGLLGLCVPDDGDETAPSATSSLSRELLPASGPLVVTIVADEALAVPPIVQVGDVEKDAVVDGEGFSATFDAAELGPGIHAVIAILVDTGGNVGLVAVGAVLVDAKAPDIDAQVPVELVITPPPGVVVAEPTQVMPGARVRIVFDVTEELAAPPRVVAGRDGVEVPFVFAGDVAGALAFELAVDEPLPDGAYTVTADLLDLAGNAARVDVDLPAPGIVAAVLVSSPCVARDASGAAVCTDFDGDGFFGHSLACPSPDPPDCDDADPLTFLGAIEIPGDLRDNDCLGDGDVALDETLAVFSDPAAPSDGDGTRAAPFRDLYAATNEALLQQKWLALRAGSYGVVPAGWFTSTSVIAGLDEAWNAAVGARTRIEFVDGRDTVFPGDVPHMYIGVELVSANNVIDSSVHITLARSTIQATNGAILSPEATLIDSSVVSGSVVAGTRLTIINSDVNSGFASPDGVVLRSRIRGQLDTAGVGTMRIVSSSIIARDTDRGTFLNGQLKVYGSTWRVVRTNPGELTGAVIDLFDGTAGLYGSVLEAKTMLINVLGGAGSIAVERVAVVSDCGFYFGGCVLLPTAGDCNAAQTCIQWDGVTVLDNLTVDDGDEHILTNAALGGPGPALLELGAPTSAAGDLVGRCRDTSAPGLGANELR